MLKRFAYLGKICSDKLLSVLISFSKFEIICESYMRVCSRKLERYFDIFVNS